MKIDQMQCRFDMIFGKSMISRIMLLTSLDGEDEKIIVDVHGLSYREEEQELPPPAKSLVALIL